MWQFEKTPLEVFKGYERMHIGDKAAAIRMQLKYGKEPDTDLLEYWKENGYSLDMNSYGRYKGKAKEIKVEDSDVPF